MPRSRLGRDEWRLKDEQKEGQRGQQQRRMSEQAIKKKNGGKRDDTEISLKNKHTNRCIKRKK